MTALTPTIPGMLTMVRIHSHHLLVYHRPLHNPTLLYPNPSEIPSGNIQDLWLEDTIHLNDLKTSADFVRLACTTQITASPCLECAL
jgi:hypothetical protein